jgi:hypothetical protein
MSLKNHLIQIIAPTLVNSLLSSVPKDATREKIDLWIDEMESYVISTPNKFDDTLLYFFKWLRQIIELPDDDVKKNE